jgi:hypothetical protein
MGGGLIQLVLKGNMSEYITLQPHINYYKYVLKKHTNFSMETIVITSTGDNNIGFRKTTSELRVNFKIKRYADLLSNLFLTFNIPDIYSDNIYKFRWVNNLGFNYIKEARIKIGVVNIETLYGEWMNIWNELTTKDSFQYNKLIGNIDEYVKPFNFVPKYRVVNNRLYNITYPVSIYDSTKSNNPSIKKRKIQVPLDFWFTKNPSLALPLLKLENNEVELDIYINDRAFEGLYQVWSNILNTFVSPSMYNDVHNPEVDIDITTFVKPSDYTFNVNNELLCTYVYLDSAERSSLLLNTNQIDYIVNTVKKTPTTAIGDSHTLIDITNANHHIKEIIWITRRSDSITNFNNYTNYTADHEYNEGMGILERAAILWNREISRADYDANYYNQIQPYKHHTNIPRTGVYCYSFALFPEKQINSGSYDNTQISTSLSINVNTDIKRTDKYNYIGNIYKEVVKINYPVNFEISIYVHEINVFTVLNGSAGLKFS